MPGARPVKNSLTYELGVAAFFATQPIRIDNWELKLAGADIDPNRRPYPNTLTNAGYSAEVDLTITKASDLYHISCKFSEREPCLSFNSPDFLKAVMELMPLNSIENLYPNQQMHYFLATNELISKHLREKGKWTDDDYSKLRNELIKFAKKNCKGLNESLFDIPKLKQFFPRFFIYPVTCSTIEKLDESDPNFHKAFDTIPRSLLNTPKQGLSLNEIINADLTLFCNSSVHTECFDCLVGDKYCHIGRVKEIKIKLDELLRDKKILIIEIEGKVAGIDFSTVSSSQGMPPELVTHLAGLILNSRDIINLSSGYTLYIVPGSYRIIAFDAYEIASKIKSTRDNYERVYPLKVEELRSLNLGYEAIQEITQLVYLKGFRLTLAESRVILDEDLIV